MGRNNTTNRPQRNTAVAVVNPVGGHGGAHYYDFGLCRGLISAGYQVSLYTSDETVDPVIHGLGFYPFYRRVYNGASLARAMRYIAGTFAILKRAAASGESVFHLEIFSSVLRELFVVLAAKLFRRKVVLTVHDVSCLAGTQRGKRMLSALTYRLAHRLIVHNKVSAQELIGIGVRPAKISIIRHGNYLDCVGKRPSQTEARDDLDIPQTAKVVLFFGQIKDAKGLDILLEAMPTVTSAVKDVLLLIAGRPWKVDFSVFDTLIDRLKIRSVCRLHIGYIPDQDIAKYYAAADVIVLPYRRIYQSGVLIMAMTYGRAVIVSDLPGMIEIVTDGVNGYVFEQGSSKDLARAVVRSLKNDVEREKVAARAFSYMKEHHDWRTIAEQTAEVYDSILERAPARVSG